MLSRKGYRLTVFLLFFWKGLFSTLMLRLHRWRIIVSVGMWSREGLNRKLVGTFKVKIEDGIQVYG
jgi:hypothetical protein